jgi:hypothetical protein
MHHLGEEGDVQENATVHVKDVPEDTLFQAYSQTD